ncbi:MAG: N-acetylgalactosamine 6-sulfate sulfatase [Planctomycetaceae bacterium]|nr:N-acetylgalactosamine 6-sulfate sulfatase [Planctomycetaceae bacterium]
MRTGFGFLLLFVSSLATAADRPNIIFIMVDDLGPEWIGCYGGRELKTPHIDALAAGGMRFTNAYSMPQCTPTRATLLTGQYPFRHGWCNHWDVPRWGAGCHFDPKHNLTFARVLKPVGYKTAIAGKWQINDFRVQPDVLRQHGFDEWCMWTGYETGKPASGKRYWDPYIYTSGGKSRTHRDRFGPDVFTAFLVRFLETHRDSPMLVYFPMVLTHGPVVHTPAELKARTSLEKHKAMVRYTDRIVGQIVSAVDRLKLRRRTIIFFTTDNGTAKRYRARMGDRLVRGGKGLLTENGPRQPFIVNGPGIVPAGVVTDALTDFTDMLPTFADLAGARVPRDAVLDGHSLAGLLRGRKQDGTRQWILAMGRGAAALDSRGVRPQQAYTDRVLRDKRFKVFVEKGQITRLHDLQVDPGETANLVKSPRPSHVTARRKFATIIAGFPKQDPRPRYTPTPPQPWDRKPDTP